MRAAAIAPMLFAALLVGSAPTSGGSSPPPDIIPPGLGKPPPPIMDPFAAPPGSIHPSPGKVPGATKDDAALEATTAKFNAYVKFMNGTLRVGDSLDRYESWVNMRTGPTGRERVNYGLYGVNDTRTERAAATAALTSAPLLPELDDAMRAYIAADDAIAPILDEAAGYYGRADYRTDHMAGGKALHGRIVAAAGPFLAARAQLEAVMRTQKLQFDMIRLATIEQHEGRDALWHVTNVMMGAKHTLDRMQASDHVDMAAFDGDMAGFGEAVKAMDGYAAGHPNALSAFTTCPDSMLARLREVQGRLVRTRGDLRRAAGLDMTFILSDYNTMVTTAQTATLYRGR